MPRVVAIVATVLLASVACGVDDDDASQVTKVTSTPPPTSPPSTGGGPTSTSSAPSTSVGSTTPPASTAVPTPPSTATTTAAPSTTETTAPTTPAPLDACANDFIDRQDDDVEMGTGPRGYVPVGNHDHLPCGANIRISAGGSASARFPDGDCTITQLDDATAFFASRPSEFILLRVVEGIANCSFQGSAVSIEDCGVVATPQSDGSQLKASCNEKKVAMVSVEGSFRINNNGVFSFIDTGELFEVGRQVVCGDNCSPPTGTTTTTFPPTTTRAPTTTAPGSTTTTTT